MWILFLILGLITPRITILILWFLSTWFQGVFQTYLWPILGFFFFPHTLLWYSAVSNWYGGTWNEWHIAILVLAVLMDIGRSGRHAAHQRHHLA